MHLPCRRCPTAVSHPFHLLLGAQHRVLDRGHVAGGVLLRDGRCQRVEAAPSCQHQRLLVLSKQQDQGLTGMDMK